MSKLRFEAKERKIFRWHDGIKSRASDPLAIERKLHEAAPDLASLLKMLKSYDDSRELQAKLPACDNDGKVFGMMKSRALEAAGEISLAVRHAFGLAEVGLEADEAVGMPEADCIRLLAAYHEFMAELEEAARPLPCSPPASEPAASTLTTAPSADSTPIAAA